MKLDDINAEYLMFLLLPFFALLFGAVFYLFGRLATFVLLTIKRQMQGR